MMEPQTIITGISLAFGIASTAAAIYFAVNAHRLVNVPTLDLKITELPPYKDDVALTEVTIKNIGKRTSEDVSVYLTCSWADDIDYKLKFPSDTWTLQPNEEYRWKLRLTYGGSTVGGKVTLIATDGKSNWQISERIA